MVNNMLTSMFYNSASVCNNGNTKISGQQLHNDISLNQFAQQVKRENEEPKSDLDLSIISIKLKRNTLAHQGLSGETVYVIKISC